MAGEHALDLICKALGFVLAIDPAGLRDDTPLADIGADSVAVIAAVDLVDAGLAGRGITGIDDDQVRTARTVGDLAATLPPFSAQAAR